MTQQTIEQHKAAQRVKYPNVPDFALPKLKVKELPVKNPDKKLQIANPNFLKFA